MPNLKPLNDSKVALEEPMVQQWIWGLWAKLPDLLEMANGDGWKYLKHIKDAAIYTRNSERNIVQVKGIVDFPFTPDEVVS